MKFLSKIIKFYRNAYLMGHYPPFYKILFSSNKIYVYCGFLGDKNFGDEIVFESAKKIFSPHLIIPFKKYMPLYIYFFFIFFKSKISGIIIGGGTLIGALGHINLFNLLIRLKKLKKPVFIHGTGVTQIINSKSIWRFLLNGNNYGGVRGAISKNNIKNILSDSFIAGDAAFYFYEPKKISPYSKLNKTILINFGTHSDYAKQNISRAEVKRFIKHLIQKGIKIEFLPLHYNDVVLGKSLKMEFPEIILLNKPDCFNSALDIFSNCSFAIGERLHFIVMALLAHCPFISINYGDKHEDLLMSIELNDFGFQPGSFTFNDLQNIYENRSYWNWESIDKIISKYKEFQFSEARRFILSN